MRKTFAPCSFAVVAALGLAGLATSPALAQSTAFTYQGRLDDAGAPAAGVHDFHFSLYDAASGGTQLATTLCLDNVGVAAGVFTAQLDFGQQFTGVAGRYLEIEVRKDTGLGCGDGTGFVLLAPRQPITAAPIAVHANAAFALDAADGFPANAVFVDDAGSVGIGTTSPQSALHVVGGLRWGGAATDYVYSGEDGSGYYHEQKAGSVATSRIRIQSSKSGDLANYSQFFVDPYSGFYFLTSGTGNGNVGIGTATPAAKLDVRGDIKLGSSGQYQAASGTEMLRMLRGVINDNGSTAAGTGFSSSRVIQGVYRINYTSAFSGTPAVTISPHTGAGLLTAYLHLSSTTGFNVYVYNASGGSVDVDFDFCVMGVR